MILGFFQNLSLYSLTNVNLYGKLLRYQFKSGATKGQYNTTSIIHKYPAEFLYLWFTTVTFFIVINHIITTDRFFVNIACFGGVSKAVSSSIQNKVLKIISAAGAEIPGSPGKRNIIFYYKHFACKKTIQLKPLKYCQSIINTTFQNVRS